MREHGHDDLGVVAVAVREQRPDRAVDQARDQRLLLGGAPFALEIAARDAPRGESLFLIIDGEGEEIDAGFRRLGRDHGGEHGGLAIGGEHRAVGLTRDAAGFEHELAPGPLQFFTMDFKHLFVFHNVKGEDCCHSKTARGCRKSANWREGQRLAILP